MLFTSPTLPSFYFASPDGKPGSCQLLLDPAGELNSCEDIRFWEVKDHASEAVIERRVLLTCDPNRKNWNTVMGPLRDPNPLGALWVVDLTDGAPTSPRKLSLEGYPPNHDFHPLGFDITPAVTPNGVSHLFVVNHARERSTIEQFTLTPSQPTIAKYVRTITHKSLIAPNSIALTSNTSFYVTNDHLMTRRLPSILGKTLPITETVLSLPLAFVSYVEILKENGKDAILRHSYPQVMVPFANGIAVSPDGSELAVASSSMGEVRLFNRVKEVREGKLSTEKLVLSASVRVPFAPDNVDYTHSGSKLLVTGHPNFGALTKVGANVTGAYSPSWVVAVSRREADGDELEEDFDALAPFPASKRVSRRSFPQHSMQTVYQSSGDPSEGGFSGSTTALWDEEHGFTFVSGLYEPGLLYCR